MDDEEHAPIDVASDDFMESSGINFVKPVEADDMTTPTNNQHIDQSMHEIDNTSGGLKLSIGGGKKQISKRSKRRADKKRLDTLITKQVETAKILTDTISHHAIPTMRDCLIKLDEYENLTSEGFMALHDAFVADYKNMVTFMLLTGAKLKSWIEHIISKHPTFYASPVWM